MVLDVAKYRLSRRALRAGLIGGMFHAVVGVALWHWFQFTDFASLLGQGRIAFVVYNGIGLVILGAVPAVLLLRSRLVSPALIVGSAFVWSAYETWQVVQSGLVPVDPTPFGWYLLLWVAILAVVSLVGGLEYRLRDFRID